jgi:Gram-negative bacterial TonB protein C-terminal
MKKVLLLILLLLVAAKIFAQTADWETLRTDDGEFSMKMPAGCYTHFYNPDGIIIHEKNGGRYHLKEMRLVTCFREGTLLDAEIYESAYPRQAVEVLQSRTKADGKKISAGEDFNGVEEIVENEKFTLIQRFIVGKKRVYIITAATRGEPNEMMKTFLESLKFASADKPRSTASTEKFVSISALKNFTPELIYETDAPNKSKPSTVPAKDEPTVKKAVVLSLPPPSFTKSARENKIGGNVSLRLTLGADGRVNQFRVLKKLPDGLLREAVVAAMRIKYLPEEQNGKPRSSIQLIEYNFRTY